MKKKNIDKSLVTLPVLTSNKNIVWYKIFYLKDSLIMQLSLWIIRGFKIHKHMSKYCVCDVGLTHNLLYNVQTFFIQCINYFRYQNGLYSINALRQRPFLSNGAHVKGLYDVSDGWTKPDFRCTFLNCTPPIGKTVQTSTSQNGLGVVCAGNEH